MAGCSATFPGIESIRAVEFALGHGISPSVGTIEMLPQDFPPEMGGTLTLSDGTNFVEFQDCRLDAPFGRWQPNGARTITVKVMDRRWKWQFGDIYGRYNFRDSGNNLTINSEKTPRQLATLLLDAMNETGYDVSSLPNDTRPEVDWIGDNPAEQLNELAESLGCRVVLKLDNTVALLPLGTGSSLPVQFVITRTEGFDPAEVPETLKVISGPVRFQQKFQLEAVGKDTDGSIKPIDDLSYAPAAGWEKESPYYPLMSSTNTDAKALAQETVWKWYRIVGPDLADDVLDPDGDFVTDKLRDILPIDDFLVDQETDPDGNLIPMKAFVEGSYWEMDPGKTDPTNTTTTTYKKYKGSFSIDRERGIVMFSDFVVKITGSEWVPAVLYLTCSFNARDKTTRQTIRYFRTRNPTNGIPDTGTQVIRRDEIIPTLKVTYNSSGAATGSTVNLTDIQDEADYHLDAAEAAYQDIAAEDGEYAGIFPVSPDGAIQQVTWSVQAGEGGGARTRASRNSEHNLKVPSYAESKRIREAKEFKAAKAAFKKALKAFP